MDLYSVKPFHFILIHYFGGPDFEIEIFSPNAVEIAYPWKNFKSHDENFRDKGRKSVRNGYDYVEADKLCASLTFNASNKTREGFTVILGKDHLKSSEVYNVEFRSLQK